MLKRWARFQTGDPSTWRGFWSRLPFRPPTVVHNYLPDVRWMVHFRIGRTVYVRQWRAS